jgi:transglutaminase-like putative cysteine protease/uncharacterized membrane protein
LAGSVGDINALSLTLPKDAGSNRADIWGLVADGLLALLLASALGGCLLTVFTLPLFILPLILALLFAVMLVMMWVLLPVMRIPLVVIAVLWFVLMGIFAHTELLNGFNLIVNRVADVLGEHEARILPHYVVTVAETDSALCVTMTLLGGSVLVVVGSFYLARSANVLLAGALFVAFLLMNIFRGIETSFFWGLLLLVALALVLLRRRHHSQSVRLPGEGRRSLALTIGAGACGLALAALVQFGGATENYEKPAAIAALQQTVTDTIFAARYERERPSSLPEGDFSQLGDLELRDVTALEVTMSVPDSLYLRGFSGEQYTPDGWTKTDGAELYEYAGLFSQLHGEGFYGQTQLARAADLLDPAIAEEQINTLRVDNLNASSAYIYVPYELIVADTDLLDPVSLRDSSLISPGLNGRRDYTCLALPNQVKRYPQLVFTLYSTRQEPSPELTRYLIAESHYNVFVYDAYTALPDETRAMMRQLLGEYTLAGDSHVPYQQAKQQVLDFLSTGYRYSETIARRPPGVDFAEFFLQDVRSGYSVHYATAAVLMFRYLGIPARYVEGYLITPSDAAGLDTGATLTVSGLRAHAWAEIYQDGLGWVPFETTPGYLNIMEQPDILQGYDVPDEGMVQEDPEDSASQEMTEDNYEDETPETPLQQLPVRGIVSVLLGVLILAALAGAVVWVVRRRLALRRRLRSFEGDDVALGGCNLFLYALDLLVALGTVLGPGSLKSAAEEVALVCGDETGRLYGTAVVHYQEALFSTHRLNEEQRDALRCLNERLLSDIRKKKAPLSRLALRLFRGLY